MPAKAGKSPLNLTVYDETHAKLDEMARVYDPMTKGDIAVVLLRYGLRHSKHAMNEYVELAKCQYKDDSESED